MNQPLGPVLPEDASVHDPTQLDEPTPGFALDPELVLGAHRLVVILLTQVDRDGKPDAPRLLTRQPAWGSRHPWRAQLALTVRKPHGHGVGLGVGEDDVHCTVITAFMYPFEHLPR